MSGLKPEGRSGSYHITRDELRAAILGGVDLNTLVQTVRQHNPEYVFTVEHSSRDQGTIISWIRRARR